jgi:tight adherence protein C
VTTTADTATLVLLALVSAGAITLIVVDLALGRGDRVRSRLASACGNGEATNVLSHTAELLWRLAQHVLDMLVAQIGSLPIMPQGDRASARALLAAAGFRDAPALDRYVILKLLAMVSGAVLGLGIASNHSVAQAQPIVNIGVIAVAVIVAGLIPEFVLKAIKRRRQLTIKGSLADAVDLMIIAANAGHSLDVALARVGREMTRMAPQLADELEVTISELRALSSRRQALENLATRTGLPEVRALTATLIQTIRYGTPLVQSLKALAQEMRQAKLLALEEHAARLPALLSLPLMLLIMPAIFVITAGPAIVGIGAALFR